MQSKSLLIILMMLIILPFIIMSSDHNVFFVVLSITLILSSFKNIYLSCTMDKEDEPSDIDESEIDDIEETFGLNFEKFGFGAKFVKNFIICLYLIYCSFYLPFMWTKVILSALIAYWAFLALPFTFTNADIKFDKYKLRIFSSFLLEFCMIFIIAITFYHKFL